MNLEEVYKTRYNIALKAIASNLESDLINYLQHIPHIDRISVRAKGVERFLKKSKKIEDGKLKYSDPINQIQDQIGARVVVFYIDDVDPITTEINKYFHPIERQNIVPESEKEFGYEGKHLILLIPNDVIPSEIDKKHIPLYFELQIKTLFQHAFSEASHDLAYKPNVELSKDQKRKVAFTSAQSWGADQIFSELYKELG